MSTLLLSHTKTSSYMYEKKLQQESQVFHELGFSVLNLNLQPKTDLHKSKTRLLAHKIDYFGKGYLDLC